MAQYLIDLLQHFKLFLTLHGPKSTYPPWTNYSTSLNKDFKNLQDSTEADPEDEDIGNSADPLLVTEDSH
jgi:hypothetical protein